MGLVCVVILCFSITLIKGKANRSENEVFAIPGCNATLEWILGQTYLTSYTYTINVSNANGIEIARMEFMKCKHVIDYSMYCEVRNISDKEWRLSVVLVHVTQANSGKYTCQIAYGARNETRTKELKIIDKPQIRNSQKSILDKPLSTTCTVDGEFDDLIYHWKLNGTYFRSTKRINTNSSYLTFERLTMGDKFSLFSYIICSEMNCCIESEPYALDPYYGPDKVTLNLNESDIYLRVNESLKIKCSAKCHPVCYFMWDGYIHINVENGELVINRFDSRMDGVYTCIATNPETNETAKSRPIFLHYVPDSPTVASSAGDNGGHQLGLLGLGLVIIAVVLVIIGFLVLVTLWRKNASRGLGFRVSRPLCQPDIGLNIITSSREITEKLDRPLPTPPVQANIRRNVKRSSYPKVRRKSKSLNTLFDDTLKFWNPVQKSMSLQTLIHLSHTIGRRTNSEESVSKMCTSGKNSWQYNSEGPADGIELDELYSKIRNEKKLINDDRKTDAISLNLNSSRHGSYDHESQNDLYSTIDEDALSINYYDSSNEHNENLQQDRTNSETGNYVYDYATLPALVRDVENTRLLQVDEN